MHNWTPLRAIETVLPLETMVFSPSRQATLAEVKHLARQRQLTRLCISAVISAGSLTPLLALQSLQFLQIQACGRIPLPVLRPGELPKLRELHHLDTCEMDARGVPVLPEVENEAAASRMGERARQVMSSIIMLPGICKIVGNSYLLKVGLPQQMEGWKACSIDKTGTTIPKIREKIALPEAPSKVDRACK